MDQSSVFALLAPMVTGVTIGAALKKTAWRKSGAQLFEGIALKFFLPFFVFDALQRDGISPNLIGAVVLGFLIPLSLLALASIYQRWMPEGLRVGRHVEWRLLVSTFGGGNRGTALLYVAFAGTAHFNEILAWFAFIDLGNFACLLFVFPSLLARTYSGSGDAAASRRPLNVANNYGVWMVAIVAALFALRYFMPEAEAGIAETATIRKFIFSMLLFAAIALRFEPKALDGFQVDILATWLTRAAAIVVLAPPVLLLFGDGRQVFLAAVVLLLMPPSSVLPAMVAQTRAHPDAVAYVGSFAAVANVVYVLLLVLAALVAIGRTL